VNTELSRFVTAGGDNTPRPGAADQDRLIPVVRVVTLFDRRIERIHVDMEDTAFVA